VEAKDGAVFWNGTVTAISYREADGDFSGRVIDAYKIQYSGWSARFTEWVHPSRVVEPSDHNMSLQVSLSLSDWISSGLSLLT
jgi:hypothetical protein